MNTNNTETRSKAQIWWGNLCDKDRETLLIYYTNLGTLDNIPAGLTAAVHKIYLSEHPIEAVKEESSNREEGFTHDEWVIGNIKTSIICKDKMIAYTCAYNNEDGFIVTQSEAEANARLIAESKNMLSIVKQVKFWFDNEANYPLGTAGYKIAQEAKAILNRINNQVK